MVENTTDCGFTCYDNSVSGDNLITSLVVNTLIGAACLLGYCVWRNAPPFGIYRTRVFVPGVRNRPAALPVDGFKRIWSWCSPMWMVSDRQFLLSAGFDALVSVRVIAYGLALFVPLTIFGIGVLLPVNYTSVNLNDQGVDSSNITHVMLKMTISNIPNGSPLLWVHFTFMTFFVVWACYLLLVFFEEHIALRYTMSAARIDPEYVRVDSEHVPQDDDDDAVQAIEESSRIPELEVERNEGGDDGTKSAFAELPQLASMERFRSMTSRRSSTMGRKSSTTFGGEGSSSFANAAAVAVASVPELEEIFTTPAAVGDGSQDTTTTTTITTTITATDVTRTSPPPPPPLPLPSNGVDDGCSSIENGGVSYSMVDAEKDGISISEDEYNLWPVRRGDPPALAAGRPPHAGQYTVLVLDEPTRKIRIKKDWKIFGVALRMARIESMRAVQDNVSTEVNGFWQQEAMASPPVGRVRKHHRETKKGAIKDMFQAVIPAGLNAPWESKEKKDKRRAGEVNARMRVVEASFQRLFGDDFDRVVPVFKTQDVDVALNKLCQCQAKLARMDLTLSTAESDGKSSEKRVEKLRMAVDALLLQEEELKKESATLADAAMKATPCDTFIAVFHTAKAAAMAVELNVNPINWRGFHLAPGPDPDNINWTALQRSWWSRNLRTMFTFLAIVVIMLLPIGLFTGSFSQLNAALCGGSTESGTSSSDEWFCGDDFWARLMRGIVTGMLPSILMSIYQSVFLPIYIYVCVLAESKHVSLSAMDMRCASLFFTWNWANFFLGSLLGGTVFNGIREAIDNPRSIITLLGDAVPASSNFFISYVMYRALAMGMFRLMWPHACCFPSILQWLHILPMPKTPQDVAFATPLRNCRYSRDVGVSVFAVFVSTLGYSVIAPFILPFAVIYFFIMLFVWRYQQLYIFQAAYNSKGQLWSFAAHRIVACLSIMVIFTSAMFFVKQAYVQGAIGLVGHVTFLIMFNRYLSERYDSIFQSTPMAILESAPRVQLDPALYTPPPLRQGAEGWHLQWGRCWQGWGAPAYGI